MLEWCIHDGSDTLHTSDAETIAWLRSSGAIHMQLPEFIVSVEMHQSGPFL